MNPQPTHHKLMRIVLQVGLYAYRLLLVVNSVYLDTAFIYPKLNAGAYAECFSGGERSG